MIVRWDKPYFNSKKLCLGRWIWKTNPKVVFGGIEVSAWIYFEPRDIWIGLYWDKDKSGYLFYYFCVIPCVPLRIIIKVVPEQGE